MPVILPHQHPSFPVHVCSFRTLPSSTNNGQLPFDTRAYGQRLLGIGHECAHWCPSVRLASRCAGPSRRGPRPLPHGHGRRRVHDVATRWFGGRLAPLGGRHRTNVRVCPCCALYCDEIPSIAAQMRRGNNTVLRHPTGRTGFAGSTGALARTKVEDHG